MNASFRRARSVSRSLFDKCRLAQRCQLQIQRDEYHAEKTFTLPVKENVYISAETILKESSFIASRK
ncbi:hypothetical protein NDU88_004073 [Pleurodeles waltl]|uniref:Uncharacterized protein n=1 Tax=Pleurodeles waltl TaxID=8319 RepID=A0AAV7VHL4_PLEWA|nr:hypothetical protein NDU88_004073 [Pleurodeles waltl]